jgi:hypothetical protein
MSTSGRADQTAAVLMGEDGTVQGGSLFTVIDKRIPVPGSDQVDAYHLVFEVPPQPDGIIDTERVISLYMSKNGEHVTHGFTMVGDDEGWRTRGLDGGQKFVFSTLEMDERYIEGVQPLTRTALLAQVSNPRPIVGLML